MIKVSVIIPVYNVEGYLHDFISCLREQRLDSIEYIFIDDGSIDNSSDILRIEASCNPSVRVIYQENSGQGAARNKGILLAKGEYVGFADPDDMLSSSMFAELYSECKRVDLDLCVCSYNYVDSCTNEYLPRRPHWESSVFQGLAGQVFQWSDVSDSIFLNQRTCWNKLYRRDWLIENKIAFSEARMYEDGLFYFLSMYYAKRIGFIDKRLYDYRYRRSGASSACDENTLNFGPVNREILSEMKVRGFCPDYMYRFVSYVLNRSLSLKRRVPKDRRSENHRAISKFLEDAADILALKDSAVYRGAARLISFYPAGALHTLNLSVRSIKISRIAYRKGKKIFVTPYRRIKRALQLSRRQPVLSGTDIVNLTQARYHNVKNRLAYRQAVEPSPIRVGFLIRENSKWTCQNLFDLMEQDPSFDPVIVLSVHRSVLNERKDFQRTGHIENISFFVERGMRYVEAYDPVTNTFRDLRCFSLDLLFYDQPYGLPPQHHPSKLASSVLTAYVPYGYGIYLFDETMQLTPAFISNLWRVYLESEAYLSGWDTSRLPTGPSYHYTGYPKMDPFVFKWNHQVSTRERKTIIYAPHHSVDKHHLYPLATFAWSGEWMLDFAKQRSDIDWVFKPHPKLRQALVNSGLMSSVEVENYFSAWEQLPGSQVVVEGDYFELFCSSDMMITDCGSFLVEYLYTGKPLVRLVNKGDEKLSIFAQKFMEFHYTAGTAKDAQVALEFLLSAGGDGKDEERRKLVGAGHATASKRVLSSLHESIHS